MKKIIDKIISDNLTLLIGNYGSRATNDFCNKSDHDIFVIIRDSHLKEISSFHYQPPKGTEIDFILIPESLVHNDKLPLYIKNCILYKQKVLSYKCTICYQKVLELEKKNNNRPLSLLEKENIVWHLKHIIFKAKKYDSDSIERFILWSKFVYYTSLLLPRFFNEEVSGELLFLKKEYGESLTSFFKKNMKNIPHVERWNELFSEILNLDTYNDKYVYFEINGMIEPYSPKVDLNTRDLRIRKLVEYWLS